MYSFSNADIMRVSITKGENFIMKKTGLYALLLGTLFVAACDNTEEESHDDHDSSDVGLLEVTLNMPEDVTPGDSVEIAAHVTYDGEDETEADQVEFEVLYEEDSIDKIIGEHTENGIYVIEYTFEEAGEYEVIAHTDAHHMHTMPAESLTVTDE